MEEQELKFLEKLLKEKFANVHHRLDEVKKDTEKMDIKLDKLPCGVMQEKVKGINGKIAWIWGLIIIIVGSIITSIGWVVKVMAK